MKILHIDYDDLHNPYAAGGQAYTTYELMTRLAKKHTITVLTGNYPGAKNAVINNIHYRRLGIGNGGYMVSMLSHWLLLPFYVLVKQNNYDVITECFTAPFTVSFVPFVSKKRLIALPSFFDSQKLAQKYHLPLDIFQKLFIKKYKHFITLTDNLAARIKKLNPQATYAVIPGGVQDALLTSRIEKGTYGLYIGRIDLYNKGLRFLLEAWKDIDIPLIIAGSGKVADESELKRLITAYGLKKKVTFVGRVTGKNKIDLYRKSLFVIQPSSFETFGYVALETLAVGKLLVCFDIDGFKWIPKKSAIKVTSMTAAGLEAGIKKAIRSEKERQEAKLTNRKFAQNFQWDKLAIQFENQLKSI